MDMTNESQSDQTSEGSSDNEAGESQQAQNVESTDTGESTAAPITSESDTHDTLENTGNEGVDDKALANMTEKESSAVRKMHEATQEAAKYRKEADAFQEKNLRKASKH